MTVQKHNPGDTFQFQARDWNAFADAANAFSRSRLQADQDQNLVQDNSGIILVKNLTGSDRAQYDVAAIGESVLNPATSGNEYFQKFAYKVVLVEDALPDEDPALVIFQESVKSGKYGQAVVSGISYANMIENDPTHWYATWTADPSKLESQDFGPIRVLSVDGGTTSNRNVLVELQRPVSSDRWRRVYGYNHTAASTSTITTTSDLTGIIGVGMPLRFGVDDTAGTASASGGVPVTTTFYYAMVTAITSNTITISGAPLPTSGNGILSLYVGKPEKVSMLSMFVAGAYGDGTENDLLLNDMNSPFKWMQSKFHLVRVSAVQATADTGTEPSINVQLNNANVLTTAIQLGAAGTWVDNSAVAFNTSSYDVNFDEEVELACTVAGGSGDASDLTVQCYFVPE